MITCADEVDQALKKSQAPKPHLDSTTLLCTDLLLLSVDSLLGVPLLLLGVACWVPRGRLPVLLLAWLRLPLLLLLLGVALLRRTLLRVALGLLAVAGGRCWVATLLSLQAFITVMETLMFEG